MSDSLSASQYTESTAEIVSAYVKNNTVDASHLRELIAAVGASLRDVSEGTGTTEKSTPAVPVDRSVKKEHVVCLVCGEKLKMLRRHLQSAHGLTPDAYRELYGLKADHPLVAPDYAKTRSRLAKEIGLGHANGRGRSRRR